MQAVLLAAGKSSRFYPYNASLEHKSLVKLMGKTLLEHTVDSLEKCDTTNIVIVVGKNSNIPHLFSQRKNIQLTFVEQKEPLGMGDALLQAKDKLEESFFVLGGYHMDISDFAKDMLLLKDDDNSVVLVREDEIVDRYGSVVIEDKRVVDIVEKPKDAQGNSLRLLAIYLLNKDFLQELEDIAREEYNFEKALSLYAKKKKILSLITKKPTVTLKYAWDLLAVKDYLLSRLTDSFISKKASIAKDAVILGNVVVEDDATILEGACVKGPAYIGSHVTVGNRAILRDGVIVEEESVIGAQMEIKNSVIFPHATTHSGFIGDSIVGESTKIAAGFITANARLDRQSVTTIVKEQKINTGIRHLGTIVGNNDNIGIRVSTMPGVIIGNNVVVGPGTNIMKNIPDNTKYYTKFQEVVEENASEK